MAFIPRLSSSGIQNNPYWYSDNPFYQAGYGMPNCTCYCYGRWYEILGSKPTMLPLGNAGTWYDTAPASVQKGSSPKLGSIIVMYDPYGYYAGHVAVVEEIRSNGDIVTSNSGWQSSYFWTDVQSPSNGYIPSWAASRGYRLKGFLYLPGAPVTAEWIKGNYPLAQYESDNNAILVYYKLSSYGWTLNAICGFLGNVYRESGVNPGAWQDYTVDYSMGYGLVQWTPATKWTNYANSQGWAIDDGDRQLEFIDHLETGQYYPTSSYPETFQEFKQSTKSLDYLVKAWLANYERAGVEAVEERIYWANYYWNLLQNIEPPFDPGGEIVGLKIWQMLRYRI